MHARFISPAQLHTINNGTQAVRSASERSRKPFHVTELTSARKVHSAAFSLRTSNHRWALGGLPAGGLRDPAHAQMCAPPLISSLSSPLQPTPVPVKQRDGASHWTCASHHRSWHGRSSSHYASVPPRLESGRSLVLLGVTEELRSALSAPWTRRVGFTCAVGRCDRGVVQGLETDALCSARGTENHSRERSLPSEERCTKVSSTGGD